MHIFDRATFAARSAARSAARTAARTGAIGLLAAAPAAAGALADGRERTFDPLGESGGIGSLTRSIPVAYHELLAGSGLARNLDAFLTSDPGRLAAAGVILLLAVGLVHVQRARAAAQSGDSRSTCSFPKASTAPSKSVS